VVEFSDVLAAARRLEGVAHRTPALTSRTLDERIGAKVFLKAENLQRVGAFKFRGAYNKISSLSHQQLRRGVATYSSGNHAQAVALAARLIGTRATILTPEDAPAAKVEATRAYGAEIVTYDRYVEDRADLGAALANERRLTLVPPYDDPFVIAGQGTATLELLEDVEDLDALLVPVGGGGLISGAALAVEGSNGGLVFGVEPAAGDDTRQSLLKGERVRIEVPHTIADGQQVETPGVITFEIMRRKVADIVTVTDDQIIDAMAFAFDYLKTVLEPSGASALAALLAGRFRPHEGQRVGVILSGGNVGVDRFVELIRSRG
jgi:threo-3-hydroxy-L-aspartate ammonia-lyase